MFYHNKGHLGFTFAGRYTTRSPSATVLKVAAATTLLGRGHSKLALGMRRRH